MGSVNIKNIVMPSVKVPKELAHYHIGILTAPGREGSVISLLLSLQTIMVGSIPVDIFFNRPESHMEEDLYIPNIYKEVNFDIGLHVNSQPTSICFGRNYLARLHPTKEYIIWLDDDAIFTNVLALYNIAAYNYLYDGVVGTYNNSIIAMSKRALAKVNWWDERYDWGWEDVDFHHRLGLMDINFVKFPNHAIATHVHCKVNHYGGGKGPIFHKQKWGNDANPHITRSTPLVPDILLYPEETKAFLKMKTLKELYKDAPIIKEYMQGIMK